MATQLVRLQRTLQEYEIGDLIFENGSAAARMNLEATLPGCGAGLLLLLRNGRALSKPPFEIDCFIEQKCSKTYLEYSKY